jgi:hypothetical protein
MVQGFSMKIMDANTGAARRCAVLGLLFVLYALNCLAQAPPLLTPKPRPALLIDEVVAKGSASQIPSHLSLVLGITTTPQPTAVKQAVMRDGESMHTFNVRSDQHGDVVLMAYDTRTRTTKAYLTDPAGTLRKAVSYQPGEAPIVRNTSETSGEFTAEIKFWLNLLQTATPAPR